MTATAEALSAPPSAIEPGSFRHAVLQSARRFKSTWVDLGKLLVKVRDEGLFQTWGFESFEQYCWKELHIRKQTALKLTRSFSFLAKHEPKAVANEDIATQAPAFEVVEVLANAEERGQLSASEYRSIRDSIWNPERPASELKREFVERFPAPEGATRGSGLRRLAGLARKLAHELSASKDVPKAIAERAAALAEDMEGLLQQKG